MSEQNRMEFEKWAKDHEYAIDDYVYALEIWNAAKTHYEETWLIENEKKILALEGEVAELTETVNKQITAVFEMANENDALQANNNHLREALDMCSQICIDIADSDQINDDELSGIRMCEEAIDALIRNLATPAESLQAFENEVISMIVAIVDDETGNADLVARIEALKGK